MSFVAPTEVSQAELGKNPKRSRNISSLNKFILNSSFKEDSHIRSFTLLFGWTGFKRLGQDMEKLMEHLGCAPSAPGSQRSIPPFPSLPRAYRRDGCALQKAVDAEAGAGRS